MQMIQYKGFVFPKDTVLVCSAALSTLRYRRLIKKMPPVLLFEQLRAKKKPMRGTLENNLKYLAKTYRAATSMLVKVLRSSKPCLARSFVVYEQAMKRGVDAQLFIGVKSEEDALAGHGWVEIGGAPFMECAQDTQNYTVMISG